MHCSGTSKFFYYLDRAERPLCATANALADVPSIHRIFAFFSKLGDGAAWVLLFITIGLFRPDAGNLPVVLIGASIVNLGLYKLVKEQTVRNRPCMTWEAITPKEQPLDNYSFPSGHTLHAVTVTLLVLPVLPLLGLILVPVTVMIMLSRIILGLHYPTDVVVAALIGSFVAFYAGGLVSL
jgi:undecaprenyl-diphosphatase